LTASHLKYSREGRTQLRSGRRHERHRQRGASKTGCGAGSEAAFVSVPPHIRPAVRSNKRVQLSGRGLALAPCAVAAVVAAGVVRAAARS